MNIIKDVCMETSTEQHIMFNAAIKTHLFSTISLECKVHNISPIPFLHSHVLRSLLSCNRILYAYDNVYTVTFNYYPSFISIFCSAQLTTQCALMRHVTYIYLKSPQTGISSNSLSTTMIICTHNTHRTPHNKYPEKYVEDQGWN